MPYLIFTSSALVVSELDDLEVHLLLHPECTSVLGVWVDILPMHSLLLGSTNWHPLRLEELVALVVSGEDLHL